MSGTIRIEQRDRVLLATLSNPPHALFDDPLVGALDELVTRAETDDGVGAVVLTGDHPERFLAHYDVGELLHGAEESPSVSPRIARGSLRATGAMRKVPGAEKALSRTQLAGLVAIERFHEILLRMESCGAVFIVAINGSAQGGGCELSLACDFRWMAEGDHRIGQPEILLGFPPGGGGTQRLARMLGTSRALGLALDGGPMSPAEALELGLIDRVVPGDEPRRGSAGRGRSPCRSLEGGRRGDEARDLLRRLIAATGRHAARARRVPRDASGATTQRRRCARTWTSSSARANCPHTTASSCKKPLIGAVSPEPSRGSRLVVQKATKGAQDGQ